MKKKNQYELVKRGEFPGDFWNYHIHPITGEKKNLKYKNKIINKSKKLKKWS